MENEIGKQGSIALGGASKYVHELYWRFIGSINDRPAGYRFKEFVPSILQWVAETLESDDVFLLSVPDSEHRIWVVGTLDATHTLYGSSKKSQNSVMLWQESCL